MLDWFSLKWFLPQTLQGFFWDHPLYLWGLLVVPGLFLMRWLFYDRHIQLLSLSLPPSQNRRQWVSYLRYLIPLSFALGVASLILALARPQRVAEQQEESAEGIDIVLALDISDSMLETDLKPTRLAAAKQVARQFIKGRRHDRVGLVVFAGEAFSLAPLTTDYRLLDSQLAEVSSSLISTAGTAIGSALATCINRLRDVEGKSKVAILLSDGSNTSGQLDPLTAADLAKSFGIKLYTIAVGSDNASGELDESTLRSIAKEGNGQFFRATDNATLAGIFKQIDSMEKVAANQIVQRDVQDFYYVYLHWGIVFLLLTFLLKNTFIGNSLED